LAQDDSTLAFADFSGNKHFITAGNIAENNRVLLFDVVQLRVAPSLENQGKIGQIPTMGAKSFSDRRLKLRDENDDDDEKQDEPAIVREVIGCALRWPVAPRIP